MNNNQLIILTGKINSDILSKSADADFLCLTLTSIASMQSSDKNFLVMEDFISRDFSDEDMKTFCPSVSKWMSDCDHAVEDVLNIPNTFSLNGHWFMHRFKDLRYIHTLANEISTKYSDITIYCDNYENQNPFVNFNSLNLSSIGGGCDHLIKFLVFAIPKMKVVKSSTTVNKNSKIKSPLKDLILRLPEVINRRGRLFIRETFKKKVKQTGRLWVVQDGYDVAILRQQCPEIEFQNVSPDQFEISNSSKNSYEQVINFSEVFFENYLPQFKGWLLELTGSYLQNVVNHLPQLCNDIENKLREQKPIAILYSLGAANVFESVIALSANKLSIPVFFFKHGGVENLFLRHSELDEFFEQSKFIQRTQFLHSKIELPDYEKLEKVNPIVASPIERLPTRIASDNLELKKILYSVGPPAHWSFRDVHKTTLDSERYDFVDNLINGCKLKNIDLDIKVHPAEWEKSYEFFNLILEKEKSKNLKLIAGGSIERIYSNYNLVVVDMISTRVLSGLLHTDMPIIVYVPKGSGVNPETINDLPKRVYVVNDPKELDSLLEKFKQGKLNTLSDDEFSEKFLNASDRNSSTEHIKQLIFNQR